MRICLYISGDRSGDCTLRTRACVYVCLCGDSVACWLSSRSPCELRRVVSCRCLSVHVSGMVSLSVHANTYDCCAERASHSAARPATLIAAGLELWRHATSKIPFRRCVFQEQLSFQLHQTCFKSVELRRFFDFASRPTDVRFASGCALASRFRRPRHQAYPHQAYPGPPAFARRSCAAAFPPPRHGAGEGEVVDEGGALQAQVQARSV